MLTVLRVSFDELAWALPTAALRNMRYLGGSRGVILSAAALLPHLDHTRATVCLIVGAHTPASLRTVHTALRNECWGGCNVEQSATQLAHGGSVSQPMADTDTHRLRAALREVAE